MMIIAPPQTIQMHGKPPINREAFEGMPHHLTRQVANLLAGQAEVYDGVGAGAEVDYCTGEGLVERSVGVEEAVEA